ncbi:MAG TPA: F0F1 ATP synthase subunit epsilon [Dehalococcoidia bacterium]|nr:F0F1 ATP synthase subunit epsilon [Dehalococcoidia bacterium]
MPLTIEIITGEQLLHRDEGIDEVIAPGGLGQLGILPSHAAMFTTLQPGELVVRKNNVDEPFFLSGGFLEIKDDLVTILADSAEAGDEIDLERAQAARERAEARIRDEDTQDRARAEAALRRSLMRIRVAERRRRRGRADMPAGRGGAE